ncbi:DUF4442 domain-containing protein [Tropicibacter sp. R15_0]|uniref:DUF4442 domain-containing protein n=1 Tax=Tropicibacter sp. R15_0 TaxID=2821101 RepID=UPI001ADCC951|nr:DUF4442 domain-containing protein [Tropicibacter sp. R15_0]MBO9466110.1 DUF4442 domain-containing protein [Tropicibacter sp. R15_0]
MQNTALELPRNHLNGVLDRIAFLPEKWRLRAFDLFLGRLIRAYATVGIRTEVLQPTRVEMSLRNRRKFRNHVGGIHGVVCQMPGEFAAGILLAHWVPKGAVVVVRRMQAELHKPIRGDIRAVAALNEDQLRPTMEQDKGEVTVSIQLTDSSGNQPIAADITMAWFQKSAT